MRDSTFLSVLDGAGEHLSVDGRVLIDLHGVHELGDAVTAEQAQDVVLQGQEEAAGAAVALTAGTATELVVDTACFVALVPRMNRPLTSRTFLRLDLDLFL